ncbi:MAG: glutathione S-transferase family protein [Alphaproteobacteria bacterium]
MTIIMHDLCGADGRRFSPYCWRVRMALAHKGLAHEARPVRFLEVPAVAGGRFKTVPVIEDGDVVLNESWDIAAYLEEAYPHLPSLFGGDGGRAVSRFVQGWTDLVVHPAMAGLVVRDIADHLGSEDRAYFVQSREARYRRSLDEVVAGREERVAAFRDGLAPLRRLLAHQPFLGGEGPLYADYIVFGAFMWARTVSSFRLVAEDDAIRPWLDRCLDLHGGLARAAAGFYWRDAAA